MLDAIVITVVAGLIVSALLAALQWLRIEENRTRMRQALCRHDWKEIDRDWGPDIVFITPWRDECRKCGARR